MDQKISFDNIPQDVQKLLLTTTLHLYNVPVKNFTLSSENIPICWVKINQYSNTYQPIKIGDSTLLAPDLLELAENDRNNVRRIAHPSLIDRFYGYSNYIISENDYDTLCQLPDTMKKKLKPIYVESDQAVYTRKCATLLCAYGTTYLTCCKNMVPECKLMSALCLVIGCTLCIGETFILCARSCCDKHINSQLKPLL